MAITFVGSAVGSATNGSNLTITLPAGTTTNDVVIAITMWGKSGASGPTTAGYTSIITAGASVNQSGDVSWKAMGGTPDTQVVITGSGSSGDGICGIVFVYRGVDTTTAVDGSASATGNSTNPDPPALTPTNNDCVFLAIAGSIANDNTPGTVTGYSTPIFQGAAATRAQGAAACYKIKTGGAGVSENPAAYSTWTTERWTAFTVALFPAPPGSVAAASGSGDAAAIGTGITAAVASASGTGAATGASASTAASPASTSGTGAASGVGKSTVAAVASSAGTGAASGVGASTAASVASTSGTGAASGSSNPGSATATAGGTGAALGVGASTVSAVASTSGVGAASAIGASTAAATGSAAGTGAASAVGRAIVALIASAAGVAAATGIGAAIAAAIASASGIGAGADTGVSTAASVASASGTGGSSGVGRSTAAAVGGSSGTGAGQGFSAGFIGTSAGVGNAAGVLRATGNMVASSSGVGVATGVSNTITRPSSFSFIIG